MLQKLFAHSDSGVRYPIGHHNVLVVPALTAGGHKGDAAAVVGEFDGVAENIHEHFPNPYRIRQNIGVL